MVERFSNNPIIKTKDIKELNISSSGAHILLESVTNQNREYIVIVPPQGWQKSGIEIKKGDLTFGSRC